MGYDVKANSAVITNGRDRAAARAMLKAVGYSDADLAKPIVGIANTWLETMPCNLNLRDLAEHVKRGVREAGGTPMEFNTIAISDGITMGTEGMKTSLVSREVIADSIELVGRGHMFDAIVALVACDKTIPGAAMALIRLNVPSLVLYGGSIAPGRYEDRDVTIQDVFEAIGAHEAGRISDADLRELEDVASATFHFDDESEGRFLDVAGIEEHPSADAQDRRTVPGNQRLEGTPVTRREPAEELRLRHAGQRPLVEDSFDAPQGRAFVLARHRRLPSSGARPQCQCILRRGRSAPRSFPQVVDRPGIRASGDAT